jgi:hypothetical protein
MGAFSTEFPSISGNLRILGLWEFLKNFSGNLSDAAKLCKPVRVGIFNH